MTGCLEKQRDMLRSWREIEKEVERAHELAE